MDKKEIQNAILQAVDTVVENKLKNLKFNYYVDGVIQSINSDGTYNVLINGNLYNNIPSQSKFSYSAGDVIQILIKNGDWNKKFIDDKSSHNEAPTINNGTLNTPTINNGTLNNMQIINGIKGNYYYSNNDNDETALNAWLDELLNNMPQHSIQPVRIACYPAVSGANYQGFLFKTSNDYATLSLHSYNSITIEKIKYNGAWQNRRLIPTLVGSGSYAVDYIIEQGTSGIWTYRKWDSGIAECWGQKKITGYAMTKVLANHYYGAPITETYPFTFTTITYKNSSASDGNGNVVGVGRGVGADASVYQIGNSYPISYASQTVDITFNHYVKGTWK